MRTTLSTEDELLKNAKASARKRGVTLGQYVEQGIRNEIAEPAAKSSALEFPVFARGTGMRSDIDPSSNRDLFDALGGRPAERARRVRRDHTRVGGKGEPHQ